jgi:hypothetical protein
VFDDIVGKLTIEALDKELLARQGKPSAKPTVTVSAIPLSGFSDFHLKRSGGQFSQDSNQPLCQMVPVGDIRTLRVSTATKGDRIDMRIPDSSHSRAFVAAGLITVRGLTAGEELALFRINRTDANAIRLMVRAESVLTLHFHALVDIQSHKGALGFEGKQDSLLQGLNRIY